MKTIKINIISKKEFLNLLIEQLVEATKNYPTKTIFETLIKRGFTNLDSANLDNLNKVLKECPFFLHFETIAVDVGHHEYCWLVSGNDAIIINKTTTV